MHQTSYKPKIFIIIKSYKKLNNISAINLMTISNGIITIFDIFIKNQWNYAKTPIAIKINFKIIRYTPKTIVEHLVEHIDKEWLR